MSLIAASSLPETLVKRIEASPQKSALMRKRMGVWSSLNWSEVGRRVFEIAHALEKSGVRDGDYVGILAQTRPEWFFCDLAIMSLGAVSVPIYSAVTADDVHFILKDCRAKMIFVEDTVQRQKVETVLPQLKQSVQCISLERSTKEAGSGLEGWVAAHMPVDPLVLQTAENHWRERACRIPAEQLATIVYTSGTQGIPKGVELSHANFISMVGDLAQVTELSERDVSLFFLPAAHIMGRIEQMMSVAVGLTNAYCENLSALFDNMAEIKPTLLVSVPRIYEKLFASVQGRFQSEGLLQREAFRLAVETGLAYSRALQSGRMPDLFLKARYLVADRLYFSKVRDRMGGRLRFCISGGASLSKELGEFFHACGVLVLEGYGLTETTGPACLNRPNDFRFGTVGKPLPSCDVKLGPDREILVRGPMVSRGYFNLPQETGQAFRGEWFSTGDIGEIDGDGFVRIVDRKKDLIVTSGGKNISPQKIEQHFKTDPLFSNVIVVGNNRQHLSALLTLTKGEARRVADELGLGEKLVKENKADSSEYWLQDEGFFRAIERRVEILNAALPPYEQVRKFRILPRELSIEAGELTPSLKVRRAYCEGKYGPQVDEMYAGGSA